MRTIGLPGATIAVLLAFPGCQSMSVQPSGEDMASIVATIVVAFGEQAARLSINPDITVGTAALRDAASRPGWPLSLPQLDSALGGTARRVERAETVAGGERRLARLVGNPFYIGIRSLERANRDVVRARVETAFNSPGNGGMVIRGSI